MNRDLLLVVAAVLIAVGCGLAWLPLGFIAAGFGCAVCWWLVGGE